MKTIGLIGGMSWERTGPLGAYLIHHNHVHHNDPVFRFKAMQGGAINRAGMIEVEVKIENNEPVEVKISGSAVIVFQSELVIRGQVLQ